MKGGEVMNTVGTSIPLLDKVMEPMNQGKFTVTENPSFEQILNNQGPDIGDLDNTNVNGLKLEQEDNVLTDEQSSYERDNQEEVSQENEKQPVNQEELMDFLQNMNEIEEQNQIIHNQLAMLIDQILEKPETVDHVLIRDVLQFINKLEEQTQETNNGFQSDYTHLTTDGAFIMQTESSPLITNGMNKETLVENKGTLKDIILDFDSLIKQIKNPDDLPKISPKVLELLKDYLKLDKSGENLNTILQQSNVDNEEQIIWKDLIDSFSKRESMKQKYNDRSEVTSKDVTKWLVKSFEKHNLLEQVSTNQIHTGTPLSKIEQHVIHLNNNQDKTTVNQQLLKQFESIMKSSRFLATPNGTNQLSIRLNPENLGELRVRLMQMNGEMTVKIVVSTQVAKEMLESNMNQLRNMFLPHQVMIEKQELHTQGNMMQRESSSNHQWEGNGEQQSNHSNQERNHTSEDDKELTFQDLLMNVKV